jgi:NAD(P)-dependent dehydrogenase (short-subunit alcohol dehydrogenase family)
MLITGGARGIGAAVARAAAPEYDVIVGYRTSADAARELVRDIEGRGGAARAVAADLRLEADVVALFDALDRRFGRLDCLVNNAAATRRETIDEVTQAGLEDLLRSNLVGALLCAREAARRMSTARGGRGGAIVNVGSQVATHGGDRLHGYTASKGGLASVTVGLARELGPQGIRVNLVSPGVVESGASLTPERRANLETTLPLQRLCRPEEVAAVILWLASPAASYVSGAIVPVHGAR